MEMPFNTSCSETKCVNSAYCSRVHSVKNNRLCVDFFRDCSQHENMGIRWLAAIGFVLPGIFVWEALAQSETQLPEGKGKAAVQQMCGGACHELDVVTSERLSKQGWTNTVDTMISRGATGTDEEIASVIDYLALHFGREKAPEAAGRAKINVNSETAKALASDLALSLDQAQTIVDYRQKEGKFRSWDDLKKVPHLNLRMIESKKDLLVY